MSLVEMVQSVDGAPATLSVVNRESNPIVRDMLEALFEGQPVEIEEREDPAVDGGDLLLYETDDGPAVSSLPEVRDSLLTVNSDLYVTGTRSLDEIETPEVVASMDELKFSVRGYPDTSKGKLLLIEMSRFIEARAYGVGEGELHSGFQYLSRLQDERGTVDVYSRFAETNVDAHVYGIPDEYPEETLELCVHDEDCEELRRTWFVAFEDPTGAGRDAAMVAYETGPHGENEWDGFWTYDEDRVGRVVDYLREQY